MDSRKNLLWGVLETFAKLLQALFVPRTKRAIPVRIKPTGPEVPSESKPKIEVAQAPPCPVFLICPIQATDSTGKLVTARTVKISAVTDYSDTAIDPVSSKRWGIRAKDRRVKAFNGEVGDGEASSGPPYGYTKQTPGPFFAAGEINYVGAAGPGEKYGPKFYLQYDGHAGYDFPYPRMTPVLATADGELHKAKDAEDIAYGQGWDRHHTFYIKHPNGISSWYRHCEKLADDIEEQINTDLSKSFRVIQGQIVAYVGSVGFPGSVHLHFEVHDAGGRIADPYKDKFWIS